jgi:N-acetyl-alpha-D-muramate 1-phosphate uridylyltransferase
MPRPLMLFAAGFGTRMGALTADRPKPLVEVAGRPLIDHALDLVEDAGVAPVVVNLHYRGVQLERHLEGRDVVLSWERDRILETGGGLRKALPLLGKGAVFTLNSDAVWKGPNPLVQLEAAWDETRMDGLLLVAPSGDAQTHPGRADFSMATDGRLARSDKGVVYLGAQLLRTEGLFQVREEAFSLNVLWDRMIATGRLFGLQHRGSWCDVGRAENIPDAEAMLRDA